MYHVHFVGMDDGSQVRSVAEAEHSRLCVGVLRGVMARGATLEIYQ